MRARQDFLKRSFYPIKKQIIRIRNYKNSIRTTLGTMACTSLFLLIEITPLNSFALDGKERLSYTLSDCSTIYLAQEASKEKDVVDQKQLIEFYSPNGVKTRGMRGIAGVSEGNQEVRKQFQNILFDLNSHEIKATSHRQLNEIGSALHFIMQKHPYCTFTVDGHTDSSGDDNYNLVLSQKRAKAVKRYLLKHFEIDANRISAVGYGEQKPVATNATKGGREVNRRVEIARN